VVNAKDLVAANDPYIDPFAIHTIEDSYSSPTTINRITIRIRERAAC
jgi:hypothetical protein